MSDIFADTNDWRAERCGHNFLPAECPYHACGYKQAMADLAAERQDRQKAEAGAAALRDVLVCLADRVTQLRKLASEKLWDENALTPYANTEGERFTYWRGFRESVFGINATALDAIAATDTGRALADFLARLRAAPCQHATSLKGLTCLEFRAQHPKFADVCWPCQSRSPDYGVRE